MTIKSFKERAKELEIELKNTCNKSLNINGKYSIEFEEWLRDNRNKDYESTDEATKIFADTMYKNWNNGHWDDSGDI